ARRLSATGRLRDGVSIEQAGAQMDGIAASLAQRYPDENSRYPGVFLQPALGELTGAARGPLLFLLGAVGLLLLLACANLANLLLSHMAEREREFALRLAIGAARSRLVRQVMTETLTLTLMGGAAGVAVTVLLVHLAVPLVGTAIPRIAQTSVDGRILVFALLATALTAVLVSLAPAFRLLHDRLSDPLKEGALRRSRHAVTAHGKQHDGGIRHRRAAGAAVRALPFQYRHRQPRILSERRHSAAPGTWIHESGRLLQSARADRESCVCGQILSR